jgi:4-hydroxybenzoate polyprenyltransferase
MSKVTVRQVLGMFLLFFLIMAAYALLVNSVPGILTILYFGFLGSVIAYGIFVELPKRRVRTDK